MITSPPIRHRFVGASRPLSALPLHRDAGLLLVARLSTPAVTVVLLALLARRRGPEEVGLWGLSAAVFSLLEAVSSLGMRHLLPRELARGDDRALRAAATVACVGVGSVLALATLVAAALLPPRTGQVLALAALAVPLAAVGVVEEGFWLGRGPAIRLACALLAEQLVRLLLGVLLLASGAGVVALVALLPLGRLMAILLALPPGGLGLEAASRRSLARLRHEVPVFLGLEAVFQLYWRVDVLLLSALASLTEVGYYVAAYRVFSTLLLLPQSYGQVLLPKLVHDGDGRLLRRGVWEMAAVGLVLGGASAVLAGFLMRLLCGQGFARAALVLTILAIGMVPASVDQPQGKALVARGQQRRDLSVLLLATACNVGMNLLLIPPFGAAGAAWATLASLAVSVGGHARALWMP